MCLLCSLSYSHISYGKNAINSTTTRKKNSRICYKICMFIYKLIYVMSCAALCYVIFQFACAFSCMFICVSIYLYLLLSLTVFNKLKTDVLINNGIIFNLNYKILSSHTLSQVACSSQIQWKIHSNNI